LNNNHFIPATCPALLPGYLNQKHMVEVFKTNVEETSQASELIRLLEQHFPGNRINLDLDDCDKILRVQGEHLDPGQIQDVVKAYGYHCAILDS
jgi:hypothetical protein